MTTIKEEDLKRIRKILENAWSEDTSYEEEEEYRKKNIKSYGQCYVTALTIHKIYRWDIIYKKKEDHYWNKLPDGREIDFTSDQFGGDGINKKEEFNGIKKNSIKTLKRFKVFFDKVEEPLKKLKEDFKYNEYHKK